MNWLARYDSPTYAAVRCSVKTRGVALHAGVPGAARALCGLPVRAVSPHPFNPWRAVLGGCYCGRCAAAWRARYGSDLVQEA